MADEQGNDTGSALRVGVEQGAKRRRGWIIGIVAVVVLAIAGVVTAIVVNGAGRPAEADPATPSETTAEPISVRIATSGEDEYQDALKEVAAEKGLDIEWVVFDQDWVLPNTSLVDGEVDANAFQHIAYLSAFNVQNDADLVPVLPTVITQWGVFSATHASLDELPDGARIAIPDDVSNGGRALGILQSAGLITLADDAGVFPDEDSIVANPKNLEFVRVAATTIPTTYDDPSLDAVVVGTSYFDPSQNVTADSALYLDDSLSDNSLPYVNVIATTSAEADNPAWAILGDALKDPRVAAGLESSSFGNTVLVPDTAVTVQQLTDKLAELEEWQRQNAG